MKNLVIILLLQIITINLIAQKKSRFSAEINYGIQGNYFVRDYREENRPGTVKAFLNKEFIGSIGGIELKYSATKKASWGIGYSRSTNNRTMQYNNVINGFGVYFSDFQIKHLNEFFQLFYERKFAKKNPQFNYHLGLFYLRSQQQEVAIYNNAVGFEQRNFKNSNLEEGGAFAGLQYSTFIDTKFELGIKSRLYYLISTNSLEAITFTPTLTYHF